MADKEQQAQISEQEAQNAKDPNHPAHPHHPHVSSPLDLDNVERRHVDHDKHGEWLKNAGKKFGNAAIFGAGATAGADAVKGALGQ